MVTDALLQMYHRSAGPGPWEFQTLGARGGVAGREADHFIAPGCLSLYWVRIYYDFAEEEWSEPELTWLLSPLYLAEHRPTLGHTRKAHRTGAGGHRSMRQARRGCG
jgi:hypothetical protein